MVRKANGFLTDTGQFFATKKEAETYEAIAGFSDNLKATIKEAGYPIPISDYTYDVMKYFVLTFGDEVIAYITHMRGTVAEKPTLATGPVAPDDFPGDQPLDPEAPTFTLEETFFPDAEPDVELTDFEPEDDPLYTDPIPALEEALGGNDEGGAREGEPEVV